MLGKRDYRVVRLRAGEYALCEVYQGGSYVWRRISPVRETAAMLAYDLARMVEALAEEIIVEGAGCDAQDKEG